MLPHPGEAFSLRQDAKGNNIAFLLANFEILSCLAFHTVLFQSSEKKAFKIDV